MKNPDNNFGSKPSAPQIITYKEISGAEEALRKIEQKFRHLFEKAEKGILIVRGETIEFANPALERIIGYSSDEITSKPFAFFIHPDDQETMRELHLRGMQGEFKEKRYDFRVITSHQAVKWISINGQVIDWEGTPANLSFLTDITEAKLAEEQLKESENRKQTIKPMLMDLNDTVSGLLKMLQRLIGENIEISWHPAGNLWPVKIDPLRLTRL